MDRQLKKVVKNDEFKQQVWHGIDFLTEHPAEIKKYGAIALAVLIVAGGTYFFIRHQAEVREEALAQALKIDDATVAPTSKDESAFRDAAGKRSG